MIDFDTLVVNNKFTNSVGSSYSEDGFTIFAASGGLFNTGTLASRFTGSTALINGSANGIIELAQTNGNPFTLTSIHLAEFTRPFNPSVTFLGNLFGGGTVTQTFTLDGIAFGAETFAFSNVFTNLTSVTWAQVSPFHQFDNIVVDGMVSVPEPGTLFLLGSGLLVGAAFRKRFK